MKLARIVLLIGNVVFVGLGMTDDYLARPTLALCAFASGVLLMRIMETE